MDLKKQRGQFFTTRDKVLNILTSLIHNDGLIFEPSAGSGHIVKAVESKVKNKILACEIDNEKADNKVCNK